MLWLLLAQLFASDVVAHQDWWLQGLPGCWQSCLSNTEAGCNSSKCICKTSDSSASYLPSAVSCAVSVCDAGGWGLELVLGPLQTYCDAVHCPIPDDVMGSAYAAATNTVEPSPTTTREAQSSTMTKAPRHTTTEDSSDNEDSMSETSTTATETRMDADGNTLEILVPIVMGPTGVSTGDIVTSTIVGAISSAGALSSPPLSPSRSAQESSPGPTQDALSTATPGSEGTEPPARGNGSPFENMQAGADQCTVSITLLVYGALVLLMCL